MQQLRERYITSCVVPDLHHFLFLCSLFPILLLLLPLQLHLRFAKMLKKMTLHSKVTFPCTSNDPPPPTRLSLTVVCHLPLVCVAALRHPSSSSLSPSPPQFFSASLALPPPASSSAWRRVAALSASPALGTPYRSLSRLWSVWPRVGQEEPKFKLFIKSLHRYLLYPQALC